MSRIAHVLTGEHPRTDAVLEVLRAAAECAGGGIDLRQPNRETLRVATAPACNRCRGVTPAIFVRCLNEVRPGLGPGQSELCVHGQVMRVADGGRLLAVAPAHRVSRLVELLDGVAGLAVESEALGALERTLHSLINAVEAKDPYTRGHSERVQIASEQLGKYLGLDRKMQTDLSCAALLHDVGKIGSPDHILKKPGKLTSDEYEVMKNHPSDGAELLGPLTWLDGARLGVRHHHERFDGQGYPDHLKGDAIPIIARIIAVADSFDAMTSRRQYRGATGPEQAIAVLQASAGSQLDPSVVSTFVANVDAIREALLEAAIPPEGLYASPDVAAAAAAAAEAAALVEKERMKPAA